MTSPRNKLNLGCGQDYKKGWLNLDINRGVKADIYADLQKPLPFKNNRFSQILAQDILEHFTKEEGEAILKECWRVLKFGGIIKVRVPHLQAIIDQFGNDQKVLIHFLYGDTSKTGEFGAHKFGYTQETLTENFKKLDFEVIQMKKETTNIVCEAKKINSPKINLKLLVIQQSPDIGGAEVFMVNLLEELKKHGVQSLVYSNSLEFLQLFEKVGIQGGHIPFILDIIGNWKGLVKSLALLPLATLWYGRLLWQLRTKINLILMSGFSEKLLASFLAPIFGLPVIWIEYAPLKTVFRKNFYLPKILYRLLKGKPELVIVPSENTLKGIIVDTRISLAKMRLIPCGVKTPQIKIKKNKKKIVGCLARLAREKGQEYLIRAAPLVLKKIPDVEFWITGRGPDEKRLKTLSRQLTVADKVKFFGFVEHKWKIYSQMSIFVFPTVWPLEGFGLVTAEAMMVGLPVVATNYGPNPELILDQKTGLLVPPADPRALAQAVIKLLENPCLAQKLGREGKKRSRQLFSIEKIALQYFQELEGILKIRN